MKQPLGVKVFGVLFIGLGLNGLWWFTSGGTGIFNTEPMVRAPIALRRFMMLGTVGIPLLDVVVGVGLLFMKAWARRLILGIAGFVAFGALIFVILPLLLIAAVIFWYFLRPSVKAQFVKPATLTSDM